MDDAAGCRDRVPNEEHVRSGARRQGDFPKHVSVARGRQACPRGDKAPRHARKGRRAPRKINSKSCQVPLDECAAGRNGHRPVLNRGREIRLGRNPSAVGEMVEGHRCLAVVNERRCEDDARARMLGKRDERLGDARRRHPIVRPEDLDVVASTLFQSSDPASNRPEIRIVAKAPHAAVTLGQRVDDLPRRVGARVVDDDDFEIAVRLGQRAVDRAADEHGPLIHGDEDADRAVRHWGCISRDHSSILSSPVEASTRGRQPKSARARPPSATNAF